MSMMAKMVTLLRSSVRELGEAVINANASQILEQELLDSRSRLQEARQSLSALRVQEQALARQAEALRSQLSEQEAFAVQALQQGQTARAEALTQRVTELDAEAERHAQAQAEHAAQCQQLTELVRQAEARLREQERELSMARSSEAVHRATQSIAENLGSPPGPKARELLRRQRQQAEALGDQVAAQQRVDAELGPQDHGLADAERRRRVQERLQEQASQGRA